MHIDTSTVLRISKITDKQIQTGLANMFGSLTPLSFCIWSKPAPSEGNQTLTRMSPLRLLPPPWQDGGEGTLALLNGRTEEH